jgi:hypothetical protein
LRGGQMKFGLRSVFSFVFVAALLMVGWTSFFCIPRFYAAGR